MKSELKTMLQTIMDKTHTTERSGKYDAYQVAAFMRDEGRTMIESFIQKHLTEPEWPEGHPCWWFQQLPEPYRSQAIENFDEEFSPSKVDSILDAISCSFIWSKTPQGRVYWDDFHASRCILGNTTKPAAP